MEIISFNNEFKNSKILLIVLGALLNPFINSIESLLVWLCKVAELSVKSISVVSIGLHGSVALFLLFIIYRVLSSQRQRSKATNISISNSGLIKWGIASLLLYIGGMALNVFVNQNHGVAPEHSQPETGDLSITDLGHIIIIEAGLVTLRTFLLFVIFFAVLFKGKFALQETEFKHS